MLFKSMVIASASGSAGGLTASRNRFGNYFRARANPVNPNTPAQQEVRTIFATLAVSWGTMAEFQRTAWEVYAENTPVQNKLGDSIILTGMNMFVRCNLPRIQAGLLINFSAPTVFGLALLNPIAATVTGTTISVTFDDSDPWHNDDGGLLMLYVSRPVSPAINFYKGPFTFTGIVLGASLTPPASPQDVDSVITFEADQRFFLRATASTSDLRLSAAQIVTGLAT